MRTGILSPRVEGETPPDGAIQFAAVLAVPEQRSLAATLSVGPGGVVEIEFGTWARLRMTGPVDMATHWRRLRPGIANIVDLIEYDDGHLIGKLDGDKTFRYRRPSWRRAVAQTRSESAEQCEKSEHESDQPGEKKHRHPPSTACRTPYLSRFAAVIEIEPLVARGRSMRHSRIPATKPQETNRVGGGTAWIDSLSDGGPWLESPRTGPLLLLPD